MKDQHLCLELRHKEVNTLIKVMLEIWNPLRSAHNAFDWICKICMSTKSFYKQVFPITEESKAEENYYLL